MATKKQRILNKIDKLRDQINDEVGSCTMDLINELVELELEAEKLSNQ